MGMGAALGNGCTSGHGLCGLSRLSPRSAVYVATMMVAGGISATATNTLAALQVPEVSSFPPAIPLLWKGVRAELVLIGMAAVLTMGTAWRARVLEDDHAEVGEVVGGCGSGCGWGCRGVEGKV